MGDVRLKSFLCCDTFCDNNMSPEGSHEPTVCYYCAEKTNHI
jgi:hypothetical protein